MFPIIRRTAIILFGLALLITLVLTPPAGRRAPLPPKERERVTTIRGHQGGKPRLALDGFTASGDIPDQGEADLSRGIGEVLRADLAYEDVFDLMPASQAPGGQNVGPAGGESVRPASGERVRAPNGEREPPPDGIVTGRLRRESGQLRVEIRIRDVRSGQLAFGREYVGLENAPRLIAHVAANEIFSALAGIQGLAHSRLAFVSDRSGSFNEPTGSRRRVKEIFVSDYDGANEARITTDGDLDLTPSWSPDRRAIAYTCYRRGYQDIFVTHLEERRQDSPTRGRGKNWLPAWSPDGARLAFTSNRDGNEGIYVMNADGSGLRRLTTGWAIDTSPAWSPTGTQIAFTSNRTGSPQIWVMDADGSNQRALTSERYCDRPSWSPGPIHELAYVSRTKTGFDIKVIDPATGSTRQLTFGPENESPAFSPNGRHLAFTSTRGGTQQIWTMTRTGTDLHQVTHVGNNSMVSWSR
jgi:TolB protein